jgi:hypothetical protein
VEDGPHPQTNGGGSFRAVHQARFVEACSGEEIAMLAFVNQTVSDIRRGRESWRVMILFSAFSFAISVIAALLSHPF